MRRFDTPLLLKMLDSFKADALAQYVIVLAPDSNASHKRHNLEVRMTKDVEMLDRGKHGAVY